MGAIQQIFRLYAPSYIENFGKDMPKNHLKTIEAITSCRTEAHGFTVYECGQCGKLHHIYRGCCNRHCPTCQNGKAPDQSFWLAQPAIGKTTAGTSLHDHFYCPGICSPVYVNSSETGIHSSI